MPLPDGGCHQCCTSPSTNWRDAASSRCSRASSGAACTQRQHVLQLVAKAERAARLVERGAAPQARADQLVEQPAVGERVDAPRSACARRRRRARAASAPRPRRARARPRRRRASARTALATSLALAAGAERGRRRVRSRAGVEVEARRAAPRTGRALRRRGPRACDARSAAGARERCRRADEIAAIAARLDASKPSRVDVEEGDAVGEVGVVARCARSTAPVVGIELGDDVHRGLRAFVAEHPLDVAGDAEAARAAPTGCAA